MSRRNGNNGIVLFQYMSLLHDSDGRIAALLAQVLQYRRQVSSSTKEQYVHHLPLRSRPTASQLHDLLVAELSQYHNVYIVVDDLDAASSQVRARFIERLYEFRNKRPGVRLLFTSYDRHVLGSPRVVINVQYYEVVARLIDLEIFIKAQMREKVAISDVTEDDPELVEEIMQTLIGKAHGLFLLAYQHLELIDGADIENVADLKAYVNDLSTTIEKVYRASWAQIQLEGTSGKATATKVLLWLACSGRDLSLEMVRHVLAFEKYPDVILTKDHFLKDRAILPPCKGLVRIGQSSKTIGFIHPTAYDFFKAHMTDVLGVTDAHLHVSRMCLRQFRYLDHVLNPSSEPTPAMLKETIECYPLLDYALDRFSYHAHQAPESVLYGDFDVTFSVSQRRSFIGAFYLRKFLPEEYQRQITWRQISRTHLLAVMDLANLLDAYLDKGVSIDDEDWLGWTPLWWAVLARNQAMVQHLWSQGANLVHRDKSGMTTLRCALGELHPSEWRIGQLVAEGNSMFQIANPLTLTPYAAQASDVWMLCPPLLTDLQTLHQLVDLHQPSHLQEDEGTLINVAAQKRLGSVVTKLLDKGLKPDGLLHALLGSCKYLHVGGAVISDRSEAVIGCHIRIREADWRRTLQSEPRLPLDERWMCRLITDANSNDFGPRGRSALSLAAEAGFSSMCRELIAHGARIDEADLDGWTPLVWAVVRPKSHKVYVDRCVFDDRSVALLGIAIEIEGKFSTDANAYTQLSWDSRAAEKVEIVKLLLQHSANCQARDSQGVPVFDRAIWDNVPGVADVLRQHMVDCSHTWQDEYGTPPSPHDEDRGPDTHTFPPRASINIGNAVLQDRGRAVFTGDKWTNMTVQDNAQLLITENHYLPGIPLEVSKAILSLIQLRIGNIVIQDRASVVLGLLMKEVDALAEADGQPRPFLSSSEGGRVSLLDIFQDMIRHANLGEGTAEDHTTNTNDV